MTSVTDDRGARAPMRGGGGEVELLLPARDVEDPEFSIVVPAVNEEITIAEFVQWCHQGLADAGVRGEVLIVDSSTDRTPELALAGGARVLRTPRRGLGRAYIDALPYIRGEYVIMGDADCTYDFRQLGPFVDSIREGYEFAMGSRWLGTIEAGAMPKLHRYLGTPMTTWVLNRIYGSHFTDIHCGMRCIRRDALERMGLSSQSWEYASEMVLTATMMQLRTTEVPVSFYRDRNGRISHHRRLGWFSPFLAAWINLRIMFVFRAQFFMLKPGAVLFVIGLLLTLPLSFGSIKIGSYTFSLYWQLLGVTLAVLGLQSAYSGILAQVVSDYSGRSRRRWTERFRYTRSVLAGFALFVVGTGLLASLAVQYLARGHALPGPASTVDHLAVTGLLLVIVGFTTFCFTLLLHATGVRFGRSSRTPSVRGQDPG